jgi:tRNA modification GTPase
MTESGIETIAAIATAPGEGAVAIVKVSGPESLAIADRIFRGKSPLPSLRPGGSFVHGLIEGQEGVADEVILLIYRAPHSYTREDAIEIQGHGGAAAAKRILRSVLASGARMAEPGEFTKRAFLSGRIDLVQAEAVLDLIRARTDRAAQSALEQLRGSLSEAFNALYDKILTACGDIESTLDFSEDEIPATLINDVTEKLKDIGAEFKTLLQSWDEGHILRDGASVVIAGRPNVGKSTLLNALLGKERAIVTPIAGTTRDTIEEQLAIDGYPVRIIDTAGLRESSCLIEQDGIRRTKTMLTQSDLTLYMIDGSLPHNQKDDVILTTLQKHKTIVVVNKIDIQTNDTIKTLASDWSVRYISAFRSEGLEGLKKCIMQHLGIREEVPHQSTISERHRYLLVSAHKDIVESSKILADSNADPALAASRLRMALETLGSVTGRIYHEELLNNIFSRFCIGK